MESSARTGNFWSPRLRLSPVFAGQRVDHLCQLNPLVSRGPIRQAQRISPRPHA